MSDSGQRYTRPSFEEAWRKRFINFSKNEDDAGIAGWSPAGLEARYRNFTSVWPGDAEGAMWLDVGCGAGTYTRFLADHEMRIIGMDYSYPTVLKARERATDMIQWAVADVTHLPVCDALADGVMCFGVVQALERTEPAIQELVRVVRPGGQVWVDALNSWCLPHIWKNMMRWIKGRPYHLRYESPREICRMMEALGCDRVQVYWVPILPRFLQRYQGIVETAAIKWLMRHIPFVGAIFSHAFVLEGRRSPIAK